MKSVENTDKNGYKIISFARKIEATKTDEDISFNVPNIEVSVKLKHEINWIPLTQSKVEGKLRAERSEWSENIPNFSEC